MSTENNWTEPTTVDPTSPQPSFNQPETWQGPIASPPYANPGYQPQVPAGYPYSPQSGVVPADRLIRWLAWVIDVLIILPFLVPILLIPFIGGMIGSLLAVAYYLLRDIKGASLGKMLLGLRVVRKDGQPADQRALLMRNLTFAAPQLLHFIPFVGSFLSALVAVPVGLIESICVLVKNERIGDMLAGTMVVRK